MFEITGIFKKCPGFVFIVLHKLLSTHCILIQSFNTRNRGFILFYKYFLKGNVRIFRKRSQDESQ